ncbi:MAG: hypothetical protein V1698_02960 [bacterium]
MSEAGEWVVAVLFALIFVPTIAYCFRDGFDAVNALSLFFAIFIIFTSKKTKKGEEK